MARSPRSEYLSPDDDAVVFAICRAARSPLVPSQDTSNPANNARRLNFIKELHPIFYSILLYLRPRSGGTSG
jgi:hypothetical protein